MSLIRDVKKKKEFSGLPDSVVARVLNEVGGRKSVVGGRFQIKEARSLLRKYFGVFLTNRVLKFGSRRSDVVGREILKTHMSSKKRDYQKFYDKIFGVIGNRQLEIKSVVDLGCGVNGFSYEYLPEGVNYVGVEAAGQLVDMMNDFFAEKGFDAKAVCMDLFDVENVVGILKKARKDRIVFLFQVVDALESVERNFSLKLIGAVMKECEVLVISVPLVSLGGGKKFAVKRKWLMDYLESEFVVDRDFEMFGERVIRIHK